MKVLLIDDNEHLLKAVARLLTREGYQVLTATGLSSGADLADKEMPEVVVADYNLPDGTGMDFFKWLETSLANRSYNSKALAPAYRILISGRPLCEIEEIESSDGTNKIKQLTGFLQKPFRISELQALLHPQQDFCSLS